jgi:hypothetical protein
LEEQLGQATLSGVFTVTCLPSQEVTIGTMLAAAFGLTHNYSILILVGRHCGWSGPTPFQSHEVLLDKPLRHE